MQRKEFRENIYMQNAYTTQSEYLQVLKKEQSFSMETNVISTIEETEVQTSVIFCCAFNGNMIKIMVFELPVLLSEENMVGLLA